MGFSAGKGFGGPKAAVGPKGKVLAKGAASDPLAEVEYSGDLAVDSAAELTAMEQAYRDRAKAETDRFRNATDSEFWFAVCFTSREEKDAFLAEFKLGRLGNKYLPGQAVAQVLRKP